MVLDSNGKVVRNLLARHIFDVQLNYGGRKSRTLVPADNVREAMAVAENENPNAVAVERATIMLR